MAMQKIVNRYQARGVAGDKSSMDESIYTAINPFADGDVTVGTFVFDGTDPVMQASNSGTIISAGTETDALSVTPTTGDAVTSNINIVHSGLSMMLAVSAGSFDQTSQTHASVTGVMTLPIGAIADGSVKVGTTEIATIAGGVVTLASSPVFTGTSAKMTFTAASIANSALSLTFTTEWTATTTSGLKGFVERVQSYVFSNIWDDGTMTVSNGQILTVAEKGKYWAKTTTAATYGQKVFASNTDGTIATGSGAAPAGYTDTGWKVKTPGAVGDVIIISNWE